MSKYVYKNKRFKFSQNFKFLDGMSIEANAESWMFHPICSLDPPYPIQNMATLSAFLAARSFASCRPRPITDDFIPIKVQSRWAVKFADNVRSLLALVKLAAIAMRVKDGRSSGGGAGTAPIDMAVEIPTASAAVVAVRLPVGSGGSWFGRSWWFWEGP